MAHLTGEDRSQLLLLPDAVDDYVGPDNPVRFIDAFVDGLDLEAAGFQRVHPKGTGRPGYDPGDLLKLYLYGYLNRIRSSRRLELETHRNLEVSELDLYGRELLAVDGTRIKAVNSRERNFTRANLKHRLKKVDERLERYLKEMDEADSQDPGGTTTSAADLSREN